jgi:Xaa-Pro aminopeptidase
MAYKDCNAVILFDMVNIRYFCGFTGSSGVLLVTAQQVIFLTDSRYTCQAQQQVFADEVGEYRDKVSGVIDNLRSSLSSFGAHKVGFEARFLNVDFYRSLEPRLPAVTYVPFDDELSVLRQIKDATEIVSLTEAARLNCQALGQIIPIIKPGITELDIVIELEFSLRKLGGEDKAFDFIVASGERGALPHGVATAKKLQDGELVTIDFGTRSNGYYSDETVTLACGAVPESLRKVYDVVLQAHDLALAALAVSMPAKQVDRIARDYIAAQGYGQYFGHGLGHGVGLEVHESPTLSPKSEVLLAAGMVFTIEPGIYIPGLGGVRIEDTVLLTDDGYRCLTQCSKSYRIL